MTRIDAPRGGCEFADTSDGMMVSCSRSSRRVECQYCKCRPAEFTCDFDLYGDRAGRRCNGKMCVGCAHPIPGSALHLCHPHHKECRRRLDAELEIERKADAWFDSLARNIDPVGIRDVTASQAAAVPSGTCICSMSSRWPNYGDPQCPDHRVDSDALEAMFPDWERDLGDEPPATELAREMRAAGDDIDAMIRAAFDPPRGHRQSPVAGEIPRQPVTLLGQPSDADLLRREVIASHDFDGDTCTRCGTHGRPDGTVEGSCAELLQALVNEHGLRPCPKCGDRDRSTHVDDVKFSGAGPKRCLVTCGRCRLVVDTRYTLLEERFGLGYIVEAWLEDAPRSQSADAAITELIRRQGPVSSNDERVLRDFAQDLARRSKPDEDAPYVRELRHLMNDRRATPPNDPAVRNDATIADKAAHVRAARQTRDHRCHWPGCDRQVPPAKWGCGTHWFKLPNDIRDRIWRAYRVGQEDTLTPSASYLDAVRDANAWIAEFTASNSAEKARPSWDSTVNRTRERDTKRGR